MLSTLNSSWRILASDPPATAVDLALCREHFTAVPSEYLQLVNEATELELQHAAGPYVRIWGPAGAVEMDEGYHVGRRIPGAIPIGDDGAGQVIFYQSGNQGFGLYRVGYGNLDGDDAIWIAPSLGSLLTECVGVELL